MEKIKLYNTTDGKIDFSIGGSKRLNLLYDDSEEVTQEEYDCINKKMFENKWLSIEPNQPKLLPYDERMSYLMYGDFSVYNLYNLICHVEAANGCGSKTSEEKSMGYGMDYYFINVISDSEVHTNRNGSYRFIK